MLTQAPACGRLPAGLCVSCVCGCWGLPGLLNGGFLSLLPGRQTEAPQLQERGWRKGSPSPTRLLVPGREAVGCPSTLRSAAPSKRVWGLQLGRPAVRAAQPRGVPQDMTFGAQTGTVGLPTYSSDFCGGGGPSLKTEYLTDFTHARPCGSRRAPLGLGRACAAEGSEASPASLHDKPTPVPNPCDPPAPLSPL